MTTVGSKGSPLGVRAHGEHVGVGAALASAPMSFIGLIVHNLATRRVRTILTALAVAIAVMTIVTLSVVTASLQSSAVDVLATGNADFTVAQKDVSDVLTSVVTDRQVQSIAATPGIRSAVGVLISTGPLDADHPLFLQIGIAPQDLTPFGVHILAGRAYSATSPNEIMLGYQIAADLGKHVGDHLELANVNYTIVGIYSSGQTFADSASMVPLIALQAANNTPASVTLVAVIVDRGASISRVADEVGAKFPNLATVRTAAQYGQVDRNVVFLNAAQVGARIIAIVIGVIIVSNTMLLSFIERAREFGILRAIGWSRRRLISLVLGEAIGISLLGAAIGVVLSFALTLALERYTALRGILQPQFTAGQFWTAFGSALAIGIFAALYPSFRAAVLKPGSSLRRE